MLCGYAKRVCKSISVQELIDILESVKNKEDTIVKVFDTTNFFIHFDQEGQFIDIDKKSLDNKYGNAGFHDSCTGCQRYDSVEKCCKCDGKACLNADLIVDTKKLNEQPSRELESCTDSKSEASTTGFKNDKYDLSNFSINGATINESVNNIIKENTISKKIVSNKQSTKNENSNIQEQVDEAIIRTFSKMLNIIKGDNK